MEQAEIYRKEIAPFLEKGKCVEPLVWCWYIGIGLVHLKIWTSSWSHQRVRGQLVRELYQQSFGTPSLVAVYQDYTKKAWERVLAMAKAIGSTGQA